MHRTARRLRTIEKFAALPELEVLLAKDMAVISMQIARAERKAVCLRQASGCRSLQLI